MASPTGGSLRGFIAGGKGMNLPPGAKTGTSNFIKKPLPKQRKDPNAPKNPISAYMYFTVAVRAQLVRQHPDWRFEQLGAELGRQWKLLKARPAAERESCSYERQAAADKLRWKAEIKEYIPPDPAAMGVSHVSHAGRLSANLGVLRLKKDPTAPNRGRTAYLIFCTEEFPSMMQTADFKAANFKSRAQRISAAWKEASAGVRADCEARALSERAAYKLAKESHVPSAEYAKAAKFVAAMKEQLKESNPARKKRAKVRKNQLLTQRKLVTGLRKEIKKAKKVDGLILRLQAKLLIKKRLLAEERKHLAVRGWSEDQPFPVGVLVRPPQKKKQRAIPALSTGVLIDAAWLASVSMLPAGFMP